MALYSTYVKKVLPCVDGSTWRLMNYTTILSVLLLLPCVVVSQELASALQSPLWSSGYFWLTMTEAAMLGFLINLAYFALIKHGSPLTTHIANCSKSALQTLLGVLLFGNKLTGVNIMGIVLTILGSSLYSMDRYYSLEAAKTAQSKQGPLVTSSSSAVSLPSHPPPPPPPAAPVTPTVKVNTFPHVSAGRVSQVPGAGQVKPRKLFT